MNTITICLCVDVRTTSASSYHKYAMAKMIAVTIQMNVTARSPRAPRTGTLAPADAASHASGSATVITIVVIRAMNHRVFAAITLATLSRDSSVTRHASAFRSFGSVTGMMIVMTGQTRIWRPAKVRNLKISASEVSFQCYASGELNIVCYCIVKLETFARGFFEWVSKVIRVCFGCTLLR